MSHLLDANILINFANFCPVDYHDKFWQELLSHIQQKHLILIESIAEECKQPSELKQWVDNLRRQNLIQPIDQNIIERAQEIDREFEMTSKDPRGFIRSVADTHLIAYAERHSLVIFSYESKRRNKKQKMKIPDVCSELGIKIERWPSRIMKTMKFEKCS